MALASLATAQTADPPLPQSGWRLLYVDSQATDCGSYGASNSFDGIPSTIWVTEWCHPAPAPPHEMQIDLGANYNITGFQYLPRQDGYSAGGIANYEFYISMDGVNWGSAVSSGRLLSSSTDRDQKQITFNSTTGRYIRLRALSEVQGGPWTAVAELNVLGTLAASSGPQVASIILSPNPLAGGTVGTATITLTTAPASTVAVALNSSNTTAATVPASVNVPAGATSVNFPVSAASIATTLTTIITATLNGSTGAAPLTVTKANVNLLPRDGWHIKFVDSEATNCGNYAASNALDGNPASMWVTQWCTGSPPPPHEIQIDLGDNYNVDGFQYLPRQDQSSSGNIANYEFYVSADGVNWGTPASTGTLMTSPTDKTIKQVLFNTIQGRYVRLRALREVSGGPWTVAAEINVIGTAVPAALSKSGWHVLFVDSQATNCGNYAAANALDGDPSTMWITQWCAGSPPPPHEIQIDLGGYYTVSGFQYLPRQDQYSSGNIANYEFYVSADAVNWGSPVSSGMLMTSRTDKSLKQISFTGVSGRYVRLRALSEVAGGPWTNASEINVIGLPGSAPVPQIANITLNPTSIASGGDASTATVRLTSASSSDSSITLSSSDSNVATVPAIVAMPAGATTANFVVTSLSTVNATASTVIGAALNGSTASASLTVVPAFLNRLNRNGWQVIYVDSQAINCGNYAGSNVLDGSAASLWVTAWCTSSPPPPHEIQIDLGAHYLVSGFQYLPRQDQSSSGNIGNYEFYVSADGVNWGAPVSSGALMTASSDRNQKTVTFASVLGRYVRLRALSEVNGGPWTAVAELNVLGTQVWSGLLAPSRAVNWSRAGISGGIPNRTTICATINPYDGPPDTINNALAACPDGQIVLLNAGTFNLTSGIDFGEGKGNVTLRGAGPDQTFLVFSGAGEECHGLLADICMEGLRVNWSGGPENTASWTATSYGKDQTQITLSNVTNLRVGSPLILDQCNDGLSGSPCTGVETDPGDIWVCDSVAAQCNDDGPNGGPSGSQRPGRDQQQIVTVTGISGNVVTFTPGLYMPNWNPARTPEAWWASGPVARDGLEQLSVDNSASTAVTGIAILDCTECWVQGVRSIDTPTRSHVWIVQSPHTVVRDSYFYGTKNAASQSYGIEIFSSSDALIENNIFQHIAAPQMVNGACSGCVIAYNYSLDDYYAFSPNFMSASATLHAAGTDNILFEGNVGAAFKADLFHGSHNFATVFRNRFAGFEPGKTNGLAAVIMNPFARYFNVIGNILGTSGVHNTYESTPAGGSGYPIYVVGTGTQSVALAGDPVTFSTLMRWGNYDTLTGAVRFTTAEVPSGIAKFSNPVPANQVLPASLYLPSAPAWFGSVPWPPIGPDVVSGDIPDVAGHAFKIPAQHCFENTPKDVNGVLVNFNPNACYQHQASSGQKQAVAR